MSDTQATPPGDHVEIETLADLEQGLLTEPLASRAGEHVAGCLECQDRVARLRTTRALLSALPVEPMPDAVAARLDRALAGVVAGGTTTVVPMAGPRRWWRSPAAAGSAAAAAVALLVAGLVVGGVARHNGSGGHPSGSTTPTPNAQADALRAQAIKEWHTGARYTATTVASLVPKLVTGVPPAPSPQTGSGLNPAASPSPTAPATLGSSTVITLAQMQASRTAALACGRILGDSSTLTPIAIDFATFNGKPAAVVVLPTTDHPNQMDVWVIGSVCSNQAIPFLFQRLPRPTG